MEGFFTLITAMVSGLIGGGLALVGVYFKASIDKKRRIEEEVYAPAYNDIANSAKGNIPVAGGSMNSQWQNVHRHRKLKAPEYLKDRLDKHTSLMEDLRELQKEREKIIESIEKPWQRAIHSDLYDKQKRSFIVERREDGSVRGSISPPRWLEMFSRALIKADGSESFRKELTEIAKNDHSGYLEIFRKWDDVSPGWYRKLWDFLQQSEFEDLNDIDRKILDKEHQIIELAQELKPRLERKFRGVL